MLEQTSEINFHYQYANGWWVDVDETGVTIRNETAILIDASELGISGRIVDYAKKIER
jgi:hypothetical protein